MRKSFLLLILITFSMPVHAQTTSIVDYQGFAWETGGFPPSNPFDVMNIVGVVDAIDPLFNFDLGAAELTLWVTDLVSTGQVPIGGGVIAITYVGGGMQLWEDPSMNRDYGMNPPNATAPSTFTDGTLYLGGFFTDLILYFDTNSGTGAFEGNVIFNAGTALGSVQGLQNDGFTFGGVLDINATGGAIPGGYDLQVDGQLELDILLPVANTSWSRIKSLYGQR